jgi:hypothetical protein
MDFQVQYNAFRISNSAVDHECVRCSDVGEPKKKNKFLFVIVTIYKHRNNLAKKLRLAATTQRACASTRAFQSCNTGKSSLGGNLGWSRMWHVPFQHKHSRHKCSPRDPDVPRHPSGPFQEANTQYYPLSLYFRQSTGPVVAARLGNTNHSNWSFWVLVC